MSTENLQHGSHESHHGKGVLQFTINGKTYDWHEQFIKGEKLKHVGGIDPETPLFRINETPWEDELITNERVIDLAQAGIENYVSKHKEEHKVILTIETANGKWEHAAFHSNLTIAELIKKICHKFKFAENGNYQLKVKGTTAALEGSRTLHSYHFEDCTILVFTDLGTGA